MSKKAAHPDRECSTQCAVKDCNADLRRARIYHVSGFEASKLLFAQENYSITSDSCICGRCNTKIGREYIKSKKPKSVDEGEPSQKRPCKERQPCFLSQYQKCDEITVHDTIAEDWPSFAACMGLHQHESVPLDKVGLCKSHYQRWYEFKTQRNCSYCFRRNVGRSYTIPEYQKIKEFLEETGDRVTISDKSNICTGCYNSFRDIVARLRREAANEGRLSTDANLNTLYTRYKQLIDGPIDSENLNGHALHLTVLDAIKNLQTHTPFLLSEMYDKFESHLQRLNHTYPAASTNPYMPSTLLLKLVSILDIHIRHSTIKGQPRLGTMLWRAGDNVVNLLHTKLAQDRRARQTKGLKLSEPAKEKTDSGEKDDEDDEMLKKAAGLLRLIVSSLADTFRKQSHLQDLSSFSVDALRNRIPPRLWNFLLLMTEDDKGRSDRRRVTKAKPSWFKETHFFPANQTDSVARRKLRIFYSICHLVFMHDDECSFPVHMLLGEVVHGLGGADRLMQILNRFGIVSSLTKVRDHELKSMYAKLKYDYPRQFTADAFCVTSVDNIDMASPFASVKADGGARGIHATSYELVEPQPNSIHNDDEDFIDNTRPVQSTNPLSISDMEIPRHVSVKDIENIRRERIPQAVSWERQRQPRPYGNVDHFLVNIEENEVLSQMKRVLLAYGMAKNINVTKGMLVFPDIQFICPSPPNQHVEKSKDYYLGILNEHADNVNTMRTVIELIHEEVVIPKRLQSLVVVGDGKTFEHLVRLKHEYSKELEWMVPFPGDWHTLKNLQPVLMKVYWHAGLHVLASKVHRGATLASLVQCSNFRRTHDFLIIAWEAFLRVQLASFLRYLDDHPEIAIEKDTVDRVEATLTADGELDIASLPEMMLQIWNIAGLQFWDSFAEFRRIMCHASETYKMWDDFVHRDGLVYILFFVGIRNANWTLRIGALKLMAPLFHAFDRSTYMRLVPRHLADMLSADSSLLGHLQKGGFVANIRGNEKRHLALDENHEISINKEVKMATPKPIPGVMDRIALYLPERAKAIQNLTREVLPGKIEDTVQLALSELKNMEKTCCHFVTSLQETEFASWNPDSLKVELATLEGAPADPVQRQDMRRFYDVGSSAYESHVTMRILQQPSTEAPIRRKALKTFLPKKRKTSKVNLAEKNKKLVNRCLRKMIVQSKNSQQPIQTLGRFIQLPLAIATPKGKMVHAEKSSATGVFRKRYKDTFSPTLPAGWKADCVILEGMFLINSGPSNVHKTFRDYTLHLVHRGIVPRLCKGAREVHVVFDHPGRNQNSAKELERQRRDDAALEAPSMAVDFPDIILPETSIPEGSSSKWNTTILANRPVKRKIVNFLSRDLLIVGQQYLKMGQTLITAGGYDGELQDQARGSTSTEICSYPQFSSNHEESDSRVWYHCLQSKFDRILIYSPDTDTYHVGLGILVGDGGVVKKDVIVQLSDKVDKHEYLQMQPFIGSLFNDPDLASLSTEIRPSVIQAIFIASGCDYISFFYGRGKSAFSAAFFQYGSFISGPNYPECLSEAPRGGGLLAFYRLVGTVYYKKFQSVMPAEHKSPEQLFQSYAEEGDALEQHHKWLDSIRDCSWEKVNDEAEVMPSNDALLYHWQRCCWVSKLWAQAAQQRVEHPKLEEYGYTRNEDGSIGILWDSESSTRDVTELVSELTSGCKCKTGCKTGRCKCHKGHKRCGAGCQCQNCNNPHNTGLCGTCPTTEVAEQAVVDRAAQAVVDDNDDEEDYDDEDVIDEVVEDEEIVRMQPDEFVYESDGELEDEVTWTEDRMVEDDAADGELFELQQ